MKTKNATKTKQQHTDVFPFSDNKEFIYACSTRTYLFYMISFNIIYKVVKIYCPYISLICMYIVYNIYVCEFACSLGIWMTDL